MDYLNLSEKDLEELIRQHGAYNAIMLIKKAAESTKADKRYLYMLTLTIDPAKHPDDTPELLQQVETYIQTQSTRKALHITKFAYSRETTKSGRAHWHVLLESSSFRQKDEFKTYVKKFGFIHFSKNHSETPKSIIDYISKEQQPTTLIWLN